MGDDFKKILSNLGLKYLEIAVCEIEKRTNKIQKATRNIFLDQRYFESDIGALFG